MSKPCPPKLTKNFSDIEKMLLSYAFNLAGSFQIARQKIKFIEADKVKDKCCGYVYCWVLRKNKKAEIIYVGKAGRTIERRMKQHEAGFKTEKSSLRGNKTKKGEEMKSLIDNKFRIEVYARKAPIYKIKKTNGNIISGRSGESIEEEAFFSQWEKDNYSLCFNRYKFKENDYYDKKAPRRSKS